MKHCGVVFVAIFPFLTGMATLPASGQTNGFQLVEHPELLEGVCNFYSLENYLNGTTWPPLPMNPLPGSDLYECDTCVSNEVMYFYDDRGSEYSMQSEPPPIPGEGGGEGGGGSETDPGPPPVYSTSAYLCLFPPQIEASGIVLTLTNGDSAVCYDLYATTNLAIDVAGLNRTNWAWLGRLEPGQTTFTNDVILSDLQCYYRLGLTNDCDGDSLPDAYEILVSHTTVCGYDVVSHDGYGTPDGWYLLHGLNPLAAGIGDQDNNHDGLTNRQEYLYGSNPNRVQSFAIWVGMPVGIGGLP